jgi:drug/metabolite transporter (DMT)-like permease
MEKPLKFEVSPVDPDENEKLNATDSARPAQKIVNKKKKFGVSKSLYGIPLAFGYALGHSIISITIKKAYLLSGSEQTTIRYLIQMILMFMVVSYKKLDICGYRDQSFLLISRALLGVIGLIAAYYAILFIDPSDSSSIINSSVVITALLSRILLKEKLSIVHVLAIVTAIVGVVFISQPSLLFLNNNQSNSTGLNLSFINQTDPGAVFSVINPKLFTTFGLLLASVTAFALSGVTIILKKLSTKKVHYSLNILFTSILGLPVSLLLSLVLILTSQSKLLYNIEHKSDELLIHLLYAILSSVVGVIAQILFNLSLQYEDASKVSIIKTSEIFFAFLLQYALLNIKSNMFKIVGGVLIFVSSAAILTYNIFENKHSKRKKTRKNLLLLSTENATTEHNTSRNRKFSFCTRLLFFKF